MSTFAILDSYAALRREIGLLRAVELKSSELSYKQLRILYRLTLSKATMSELADYTQADKASTTRTIETMERAGWIKRLSDSNDRRKVYIDLTPKGKTKAAKVKNLREDIGRRVHSTLSAAEQKELAKLLSKVVSGLQKKRA